MLLRKAMWRRLQVIAAIVAATMLGGCAGSPYAGTWTGKLAPTQAFLHKKRPPTEIKPSLDNTLVLNGGGDYTAKFSEVDYGGNWTVSGTTITLTPTTYMGLGKDQISTPKQDRSEGDVSKVFAPLMGEVSENGTVLKFKLPAGTVTLRKSAS